MSLFWRYFKDTLRWLLIWQPGPLSALAKGGALFLDMVRDHLLWLRDQFNPATCDDDHVIRFARSRGLKRHFLETDDDKFRDRVVAAYAWQMLGGRQTGVPKILEHYGYTNPKIINMRDKDPNRWAEFIAELAPAVGQGFVLEDWDFIPFIINNHKPARSKLAQLVMYLPTKGDVPKIGMALMCGEVTTLYPYIAADLEEQDSVPHMAVGLHIIETTTLYP